MPCNTMLLTQPVRYDTMQHNAADAASAIQCDTMLPREPSPHRRGVAMGRPGEARLHEERSVLGYMACSPGQTDALLAMSRNARSAGSYLFLLLSYFFPCFSFADFYRFLPTFRTFSQVYYQVCRSPASLPSALFTS